MSADGASSTEGATVIKHEPVSVSVSFADEFKGMISVQFVLSAADAEKIADLNESVARLYFGHEVGPMLQSGLRSVLDQ